LLAKRRIWNLVRDFGLRDEKIVREEFTFLKSKQVTVGRKARQVGAL
jgi:hypothetical protein